MRLRLRRKTDFRRAWAALFLVGMLAACRPEIVFHSFRPVPPAGWERNDSLRFEAFLPDSSAAYSLCVELRHGVSYPYCELPVLLTLANDSLPDAFADTALIAVADREGRWLGTGWGDLRTASSSFISLPAGAKVSCRIVVSSLLPDSLLPGVSDVGIKIVSVPR